MSNDRCTNCKHLNEPMGSSTCLECMASGEYSKFEIVHACSTCKYRDKGITEEPCLNCNIRLLNDKWEEKE